MHRTATQRRRHWWTRGAGVVGLMLMVGGLTALLSPASADVRAAAPLRGAACYEDGQSGTMICDDGSGGGGGSSNTTQGNCCSSNTTSHTSPTYCTDGCPTNTTHYDPPTTYYEPPTTYYEPPTTHYTPPTTYYVPPTSPPTEFTPRTPVRTPAAPSNFLPADATTTTTAQSFEPTVALATDPKSQVADGTTETGPTTSISSTGKKGGNGTAKALGGAAVVGGLALGATSLAGAGAGAAAGALAPQAPTEPSPPPPPPPPAAPSALTAEEQAYVNAKGLADERFRNLPNTRDPGFEQSYNQYIEAQNNANKLGEALRGVPGQRPPELLP
jgi:hypothetical protein